VSDKTDPTLAQRMRDAATTIEDFNRRGVEGHLRIYNNDAYWRPSELRREAEHVDAEEREKAEREERLSDVLETEAL
jgi:hypothetical protein